MRIAIDGPAGSGKSTVARLVASRLNFTYIDTGAMYRALALKAREAGVCFSDLASMTELMSHTYFSLSDSGITLDGTPVGDEIRTREVSLLSSDIARYSYVRDFLTEQQRSLSRQGNVVMEGRDIGTVVIPEAELKIFLTASVIERARRRLEQLRSSGIAADLEEILAEIESRDHNDSTRSVAPLKPATDAITLDTTKMGIEEVVSTIVTLAEKRQKVHLAKSVGFCYGVDRAVRETIKLLKSGKKVFATGEIVHNEKVMNDLRELGLEVIEDRLLNEKHDGVAVIRAHGVDPASEEKLRHVFDEVIDLTCPIVYNVFSLAVDLEQQGNFVVVYGKKNHPEVTALSGRLDKYLIVEPGDDYNEVLKELEGLERVAIVSQTTMSNSDFKEFAEFVKEKLRGRVTVHNTICKVTIQRESEAERLAGVVDTVIVIGGKNSSNTKKLVRIVERLGKKALHATDLSDLPQGDMGKVALISGTSTPYEQIQKILDYIDKMREVTNNGRENETAR